MIDEEEDLTPLKLKYVFGHEYGTVSFNYHPHKLFPINPYSYGAGIAQSV
jgi:hypothetical protein